MEQRNRTLTRPGFYGTLEGRAVGSQETSLEP